MPVSIPSVQLGIVGFKRDCLRQILPGLHKRPLLHPPDQGNRAQHQVIGCRIGLSTAHASPSFDQEDFWINLRGNPGGDFLLQRQQVVILAVESPCPDNLVFRPQIQKLQANTDFVAGPLYRTIQ
jgi:hypothetical protein